MNFLKEILRLKDSVNHRTNPTIETALRLITELAGLNEVGINTVGAYGDVIFEVSTLKVETLRNMKRKARARYATHEIVGRKSVLEYIGLEPDEITFEMQLNESLGVDVQKEQSKLLSMLRSGEANYLILGTHAYGEYKWVISDLEMEHEYADRAGEPMVMTVSVTLKEVIE